MPERFYSIGTAARLLGISASSVKRLCDDGVLGSVHTEGGHRRIPAQALEVYRTRSQDAPAVRNPSPTLQNRREAIEDINLRVQEARAKRELKKFRQEDLEETARLKAEQEAAERQAARDAEAVELQHDRLRRREAQEREQRAAEQRLAAWQGAWLAGVEKTLAGEYYNWLTLAQRKEILELCQAEISKRQIHDDPRMRFLLEQIITGATEPLKRKRETQELRRRTAEDALQKLPRLGSVAERAQAAGALRKALAELSEEATDFELRATAEQAIAPICQAIERRLLEEKLIQWAISELPLLDRTAQDEARCRRECLEVLPDMPADMTEAEGQDALREVVGEICEQIEVRKARAERKGRKAGLIARGVSQVIGYLWELRRDREISSQEFLDSELTHSLERAVENRLRAELWGEESDAEVQDLARAIVDDELDLI